MKNYLGNWNIVRLLRLVLGIIITIQGVYAGQWFLVGLGALFTLLPLLNVSTCCSTGGCETPQQKGPKAYKSGETTYEEVK